MLFFLVVVRPLVLVVIGLRVRNPERLPRAGPSILVANHNSHLDTLVLMSLFPLGLLPRIRPVAAADYFLRNRFLAWFSRKIIGIIPLQRGGGGLRTDVLRPVSEALDRGEIVILFPEGSRGEPERLARFRSGVAHLVGSHPDVPVVPVFLHGAGKALPKGEGILVPFFCDVLVGESVPHGGGGRDFIAALDLRMRSLADEGNFPVWE